MIPGGSVRANSRNAPRVARTWAGVAALALAADAPAETTTAAIASGPNTRSTPSAFTVILQIRCGAAHNERS